MPQPAFDTVIDVTPVHWARESSEIVLRKGDGASLTLIFELFHSFYNRLTMNLAKILSYPSANSQIINYFKREMTTYRCERSANSFVHRMEMSAIHEFPLFSPAIFNVLFRLRNSLPELLLTIYFRWLNY